MGTISGDELSAKLRKPSVVNGVPCLTHELEIEMQVVQRG